MATSSTVSDVLAALLTALETALPDVQVSATWPGPDATENETVFIGDAIEDWDVEIPTMKAGRKQRQETYTLSVEAWVAMPGHLRSESAVEARTRAIELIDAIDDFLADEPKLHDSVLWARVSGRGATLVPFDKGWACQATTSISVAARLT